MRIGRDALQIFASVLESEGTPIDATRFLFPFSEDTLEVFRSLANSGSRFSEAAKPYQVSGNWHEGGATSGSTPTLVSKIATPAHLADAVLTSSLIYVGNPFYKSAAAKGREKEVDLEVIPDDFIPKTYYVRGIEKEQYRAGLPSLDWDPVVKQTDLYRIAFRKMLSPPTERTLIAALIPPGPAHIDAITSMAFKDERMLLSAYPLWVSLPFDFLVKATGLSNFYESSLRFFPWATVSETAIHRALRLACLTTDYADIWNRHAAELDVLPWSSNDGRLTVELDHSPGAFKWNHKTALRSDFARRLALVEIDVLVAQALGLTIEQLIEMYRTQFHVLNENELGTWYDQKGRIVWTCSKGLTGIGFRKPNGKKPSEREGVLRCKFGDILRKKIARVATGLMNETVVVAAQVDTRRQYKRPCG